ncbi:MAG: bifunctional 3-demethylubiquinol 3-O-methyltransferase/2-polyprenyl-6-hydroxyphenol methylase [Chloroflexi bacterium]|nr:bifunctional 3-demethylubiquinol 3-O-methyltransferase/2-polyprenyl-6-hydroxyphenol methylase [Chloroflexota bacterium]|tara:strand:- start:9988 stop:10683 length:696 start_codon:yes stop_codon:yes gene_type:complete
MNIDPLEKEKFNSIADEWWDPDGKFAPLHKINPLRSEYIAGKIDLNNKKVLDVACGGGLLSEALNAKGATVVGVDISEVAIHTAKTHSDKSNLDITYKICEAEELLPQEKNTYDVVTCLEAIEHVPDPEKLVKTCSELCKNGGSVVFSTINRNPKSFLFAIIGAEYILNLLPIGTHEFNKFIKPSELSKMMRNNNLEVQELIGMSYNPLTKNYWLGQNVDVNYIIYAKKKI